MATQSAQSAKGKAPAERRKVRYAVIGLGYIAQVAILPAFANAKRNSRLAALVSDDPEKRKTLGRKYRVAKHCDYDGYDALLESGEIDAVFIALPNSMHRDFAVRAARAGIHVLCEKPLALTEPDCKAMIDAAERSSVRLMTAYRLHLEGANLAAIELARSGRLGELRTFSSDFTMQVRDPDNIRLDRELGGGTFWDIGIYCINAARYLFRAEPVEVVALTMRGEGERFAEVEQTGAALLRFPGGRVATFACSFGAADVSSYRLIGTKGDLVVEPAYEFAEGLAHRLTVGGRTTRRTFPKRDQFGPELVYFSDCVLAGREPEPSGREGLLDVRIISALYRSARTGRPEALPPDSGNGKRRPTAGQEIHRPPVKRPALVAADSPSGKD